MLRPGHLHLMPSISKWKSVPASQGNLQWHLFFITLFCLGKKKSITFAFMLSLIDSI